MEPEASRNKGAYEDHGGQRDGDQILSNRDVQRKQKTIDGHTGQLQTSMDFTVGKDAAQGVYNPKRFWERKRKAVSRPYIIRPTCVRHMGKRSSCRQAEFFGNIAYFKSAVVIKKYERQLF